MSEFAFGFICGAASIIFTSLVGSSLFFLLINRVADEEEPIEQPDIRLTKVKSEYIRVYEND